MSRFFWVLLGLVCAPCLHARAEEVAAPVPPLWEQPEAKMNAWRPLWQRFQVRFPDPKTTQSQVLRVLAIEGGARDVPSLSPWNVYDVLDVKPAKRTRSQWINALQDCLLLARRWETDGDEIAQRRGLELAEIAARLAQTGASGTGSDGDEPLRAAIGEAFLLPHLEVAPTNWQKVGLSPRWKLLETLQSRFFGFRVRGEGDEEEIVPVASRADTLAFLRLQIELCPTREANWPRVHLAQTLLDGDNVSAGDKREAFAALRALSPGSGTLMFRSSMPALAKELGETLTESETRDAARSDSFYGVQKWEAPQLEAWQTLQKTINPRDFPEETRWEQLNDLARRAALTREKRADLERGVATSQGRSALLRELQTEKVASSKGDLWTRYFRFAAASQAVLSGGVPSVEDAQSVMQLWSRLRLYERDNWDGKTAHWKRGDWEYSPEVDELNARLCAYFVVPVLPLLAINSQTSPSTYEPIRGMTTLFGRTYPLWPGARHFVEEAQNKAALESQKRGETFVPWYDSTPSRWLDVALASNDLFTRVAENDNHAEWIRYDLMEVLGAQNRLADWWLVSEELGNWKTRYRGIKQSLWGFKREEWIGAQRELQSRPTIWKERPNP